MPSLPAISSLPEASPDDLGHVLDLLFEPSPPLRSMALPVLRAAKFPSYAVLITAVHAQLCALADSDDAADRARLSEILCAHPRLGEKKVESELSRREQAQLQQGGDEDEKNKLAQLNREYEDVFPGLRYVVFVNGRPRPDIMENMRARIHRGDIKAERLEAIQAMCDIALDRATKLQEA